MKTHVLTVVLPQRKRRVCVHNTRTTMLSASTTDLNKTHSGTDDHKDDVSSNIFFPFTG